MTKWVKSLPMFANMLQSQGQRSCCHSKVGVCSDCRVFISPPCWQASFRRTCSPKREFHRRPSGDGERETVQTTRFLCRARPLCDDSVRFFDTLSPAQRLRVANLVVLRLLCCNYHKLWLCRTGKFSTEIGYRQPLKNCKARVYIIEARTRGVLKHGLATKT